MLRPSENNRTRQVLPDLAAFGISLGLAWFLRWDTADLVWSLWLSSLVTGYLTLLATLLGGAWIGMHLLCHEKLTPRSRLGLTAAGLAGGLFFLGFFSFHFCGFHAGHSVFLHAFFPVEGVPNFGFGDAFMNPLLLWQMVFRHLIRPYGFFLVAAFLSERRHIFKSFTDAMRTARAIRADRPADTGTSTFIKKDHDFIEGAMSRPYRNVVRMHLLIFFFAFTHFIGLDSFLVFAVVYAVYFFPWESFKKTDTPPTGLTFPETD